jgi:hypothetical protein
LRAEVDVHYHCTCGVRWEVSKLVRVGFDGWWLVRRGKGLRTDYVECEVRAEDVKFELGAGLGVCIEVAQE